MNSVLAVLERFFASWRFATFALAALGTTFAFIATMLLWPGGTDAVGAFAEEFRVWCFGLDPATGKMSWALVAMFLGQPLGLGTLVTGLWLTTLRDASARQAAPFALGGMSAVLLAVALLPIVQPAEPEQGELPFPVDELRLHSPSPALRLIDSAGAPFDLVSLRGHVTVVTAIYSSCGNTCPMLLAEATSALDALSPKDRAEVRIVAITLDPTHDTPQALTEVAKARGLDPVLWTLLSGRPEDVERTLDAWSFARTRNAETGQIEHANLFYVIDRSGRVAYRLGLGDRRSTWLHSALQALLEERV